MLDPTTIRSLRHELRTPINHIMGYSELLLEEAEDGGMADLVPQLEQAHAAGKQALGLINSALDPSRIEAGRLDLAPLRDGLQAPLDTIISLVAAVQRQVEALGRQDVVPDLERIDGAARHLLTLIAAPLSEWQIEPGSGPAVTPDERPAAPADGRPARAGADGGALLVVDDNESNRDMLARRLERLGYAVARAEHGRRALEMVEAGRFDLVLLDIMMPELDGYAVLERLKGDPRTRDIPVIVISALDELASVVRCIEAGAEDYLPKPFDPVLLRSRIGACLEKKRLRDQEVEYLRNVARVTDAAAAVEAATFEPDSLADVAERADGLGQLARVFRRMARQVYVREQRLKEQVQELRIEIDQAKKAREVAAITETDYFQRLQERAKQLRKRGS